MEGEALLKKTLRTIGVMVGSCVLFVGTLSLLAVLIVSRAVGPAPSHDDGSPVLVPATKLNGQRPPESTPPKSTMHEAPAASPPRTRPI